MNNSRPAGKTPYEIRLDLLYLARDILNAKHHARAAEDASNQDNLLVRTAPTSEEVIAEADKLNAFVSQGNPQR